MLAVSELFGAVTLDGTSLIVAMLSGGGLMAYVAWRKMPAERDATVVGYQRMIIEDQRGELDRQAKRIRILEGSLTQRDQRIDRQELELEELREQIGGLSQTVTQLKQRLGI